ncbi:MAG: trigger factor [Alphaproteobacteria bacterium]|nr:MAG: trigger factor [Alphaproteobacteria bacterium]
MQVTQTLSEGLKREFRVVVPANDLDSKVNTRLDELKDQVRINGFRPGKVPVGHLKRLYGRSVMAETIEATVRDANAQIVSDNNLRLAMEPQVKLPTEEEAIKAVVEGKADLDYSVAMEVLPKIELADFKDIKLERLTAEATEAEIDEAIGRIAEQNRPFLPKAEGAEAASGDKVTISFTGTIDGAPFEGGSGEDIAVVIGSNSFIPGFEEQLIGIKAGENRAVKASFPPNYLKADLAGKEAEFAVSAKSLDAPGEVKTDDDFAKQLGLESLSKLRDAVKDRIAREHAGASRNRLKRQLLDALDERHKFELPPTLVSQEFDNVWQTVEGDLKSQGRTFADEGTTEEAAKDDYRKIAERRVRLGLVIAEIGDKNQIKVTDEEVQRAIVERARQFPGQEQQVWEYYRNNPQAVASLRAPIYEEKVVDFLIELTNVTEKKVTREELYKEDDDEKPAG